MIYNIHFFLIMAGYSACGLLLGTYMIFYAQASELDLGFIFMIHPLTVLARPLICAQADRTQAHKRLLIWCLLCTSIAYLPFITIPFLLNTPYREFIPTRVRFWILVISHLIGSFGFSGVRSLGDALAVNYAKCVGSDFSCYRKYGSIGFGLCGLLLGQINQNWILPDYVPSFVVFVLSLFLLAILIYLWPDEHFEMTSQPDANELGKELASGRNIILHMRRKLVAFLLCRPKVNSLRQVSPLATIKPTLTCTEQDKKSFSHRRTTQSNGSSISAMQQVRIFLFLAKMDVRLPWFLLLIFYGGFVGYSPQNFVFTYEIQTCQNNHACNGTFLAGLMMFCYCIMESVCYLGINALSPSLNRLIMLQITLASLTLHYYFYGFLLPHLSPYFFLIESLHGLEYSFSISSSVELAHRFAREVELIIPELIGKGIISKDDNQELVKLSLMATMNSCFTLVYDGAGSVVGAFLFGLIIDEYSFTTAWIVIGSLALFGFLAVIVIVCVGKCINFEPKILRLQTTSN